MREPGLHGDRLDDDRIGRLSALLLKDVGNREQKRDQLRVIVIAVALREQHQLRTHGRKQTAVLLHELGFVDRRVEKIVLERVSDSA